MSQPLPRYTPNPLEAQIDRIIATTPEPAHHTATFTAQELRGIPAVGRQCGTGAIAETEPGWNLDHWPIPEAA